MDEVEHGGRAVANAGAARRAKVVNGAESFIVVTEEFEMLGAKKVIELSLEWVGSFVYKKWSLEDEEKKRKMEVRVSCLIVLAIELLGVQLMIEPWLGSNFSDTTRLRFARQTVGSELVKT